MFVSPGSNLTERLSGLGFLMLLLLRGLRKGVMDANQGLSDKIKG